LQVLFEDELDTLFKSIGPIPGTNEDILKFQLIPRLKTMIAKNNFGFDIPFQMNNCSTNLVCTELLKKTFKLLKIVQSIFQRPFPSFGTLISSFVSKVFTNYGTEYDCDMSSIEETAHIFLASLFNEYYSNENMTVSLYDTYAWASYFQTVGNKPKFSLVNSKCDCNLYANSLLEIIESSEEKVFSCLDQSSECCYILADIIVGNQIKMFTEIMKYSYNLDGAWNGRDQYFYKKYVEEVSLFRKFNLTLVSKEDTQLGMILFCEMIPDILLVKKKLPGCTNFYPVSTSHGICQSFNSLQSTEIYKKSPITDTWSSIFEPNMTKTDLVFPKGFGSAKGMNIILSSYEAFDTQRETKDFILSVTNENNVYDIVRQSFDLLPGNIYTFRILASQIATTEKFESMSQKDRNCGLENESDYLRHFKNYSKSACEYECGLKKAEQKCSCTPWNIPRESMISPKFCDMLGMACFFGVMKFPTTFDDCNCPSDCKTTTLSIFESSRPNDYLDEFCDPGHTFFYKTIKTLIGKDSYGLFYNHIVKNGPNPAKYEEFCRYFVKNHITIVRVEMATKSIIRSLRDKRFTFENQLSTLG
jgi:hypothetical protein